MGRSRRRLPNVANWPLKGPGPPRAPPRPPPPPPPPPPSPTAATAATTAAAGAAETGTAGSARSEAAAGIGAEAGICARRSEAAHAEAIGGAAGEDTVEREVTDACSEDRAAGTARTSASSGAVAARLLIGRGAESAARTAVDHEGFIGVSIGIAVVGGEVAGGREILSPGFSCRHGDVLKCGLLGGGAASAIRLVRRRGGLAVSRGIGCGVLRLRVASGASSELAAPAALASASAAPAAPGVGGQRRVHLDGGALNARNLESPIAVAGIAGHGDLAVQGGEAEHFHVNIPDPGGEIEGVATVLTGVSDDLGVALPRRNGCAGNELVGGPDGTAVLRCG